MAIAEKRYSFFSQEVDLPISDLKSIKSTEIFNSVNNEWTGATQKLSDIIASARSRLNIDGIKAEINAIKDPLTEKLGEIKDAANSARNQVNSTVNALQSSLQNEVSSLKDQVGSLADNQLVRDVKGIYGSAKALSDLGSKSFESFIKGQLPKDSMIEKVFSGMSTDCKTSAFKTAGIGKPFKPSISCNGGNSRYTSQGGCSSNQFSDVLNKVTKGSYNAAYSDLNATMNGLVNMTNFGYKMNMCGVFEMLAKDIGDKSVLTRGAASIFGTLAATGNTMGVLELAKGLAVTTPDVTGFVKSEFPGVVGSLSQGMKKLTGMSENDKRQASQDIFGVFDDLDPKWCTSNGDEDVSIENVVSDTSKVEETYVNNSAWLYQGPDTTSEAMKQMFNMQAASNDVDINDLEQVADDDLTATASVFADEDTGSFW